MKRRSLAVLAMLVLLLGPSSSSADSGRGASASVAISRALLGSANARLSASTMTPS